MDKRLSIGTISFDDEVAANCKVKRRMFYLVDIVEELRRMLF